MIFAAIPSPPVNSIQLGPMEFRIYGLCIALGALTAVWITGRRYAAAGGDPAMVHVMATWAIPAGIVGARLYHVLTDFDRFQGNWSDIPKLWKGGLGIWGAIAGGAIAAWIVVRRNEGDLPAMFDATAVGIPVAQAIGRLGNWFNQELFGRPSDLPWALTIDRENRPVEYQNEETFHPTFLYEVLWNLGVAAFVAFLTPKLFPNLRKGYAWAIYVAGYTLGRFWIELLRSDAATELGGIRINVWVALLVFVLAISVIIQGLRKRAPEDHQNA